MKKQDQLSNDDVVKEDSGETNQALQKLFLEELADIYNAEQQLVKALPDVAEAARSEALTEAFQAHLSETEEHVSRLEQVAETLGETLENKKCKAMKGLLDEAKEIMDDNEDSAALDAALIAAAQKVEHYEIATYGTLCAWAEILGHDEALELLQTTLDEEKQADETLTEIAMSDANHESDDDSEEDSEEESK